VIGRFFGDGSWLYNLLKRFINTFIDNKLEKEVCHTLQSYISNDLQRVMQFLPLSSAIPNTSIVFDYSLVAEPQVTPQSQPHHVAPCPALPYPVTGEEGKSRVCGQREGCQLLTDKQSFAK